MPNYRCQLSRIESRASFPSNWIRSAPSFSRRESERSIFRPDKIVLPARESFQKVKTRRYRDARFWKPAVNVTVYLGQLLTFQIFPN